MTVKGGDCPRPPQTAAVRRSCQVTEPARPPAPGGQGGLAGQGWGCRGQGGDAGVESEPPAPALWPLASSPPPRSQLLPPRKPLGTGSALRVQKRTGWSRDHRWQLAFGLRLSPMALGLRTENRTVSVESTETRPVA